MSTLGRIAILTLLLFGLSAPMSIAQEAARSFEFQISPLFPQPNSVVSVYAQGYSFDIARANVVWRINGEVVREGRGIQTLELLVGDVGEASSISFTATRGSETISHSTTITPVAVDLIVEPQTYTPLLYKGRALASHRSDIRVVALPFAGGSYDKNDFIYTWRVNGQVQGGSSGRGVNVLETEAAPTSRRTDIRVDIQSIDGSIQGRNEISVKTEAPVVILYPKNPLSGVSTATVLSSVSELEDDEVTLSAEPFYFPGIFREALPIVYNWRLNGKNVSSNNDDAGSITLRQAGSGRGRAQVSVEIEHPNEVTLQGRDSATFTFGLEDEGLFGF